MQRRERNTDFQNSNVQCLKRPRGVVVKGNHAIFKFTDEGTEYVFNPNDTNFKHAGYLPPDGFQKMTETSTLVRPLLHYPDSFKPLDQSEKGICSKIAYAYSFIYHRVCLELDEETSATRPSLKKFLTTAKNLTPLKIEMYYKRACILNYK